jgi:hypothetical protein
MGPWLMLSPSKQVNIVISGKATIRWARFRSVSDSSVQLWNRSVISAGRS